MFKNKYMYNTNFNRNLSGGKRPNKGITKYGKCKTLAERLIAENNALQEYRDRVKNQLPSNILIVDAETGKSTEYSSRHERNS